MAAAGGGGYGCPAEWAVGVALEPSVDAVDMEDMEAAGQEPDPLLFLELAEAHCALAGIDSVLDSLPVPERRQRLDCRLLEPARLGGRPAHGGHREASGGAAAAAGDDEAGHVGGAAPVEAAADDEDVVGEEEDGGGEDAQHGEHQDREARDGWVVRCGRRRSCQWRRRRWWWEQQHWYLLHWEDGVPPACSCCVHGCCSLIVAFFSSAGTETETDAGKQHKNLQKDYG